jgi:hypothetical protein
MFIVKLFFLVVLCLIFLLIVSPVIDHLFYVDESDKNIDIYKIILYILSHVILICIFVYLLHNYIILTYLKHFKIDKHYKNFKYILDLIIAIILMGLQRNLKHKLNYISGLHPIRSKLIE